LPISTRGALADAQGTLEVLYNIQEYFKAITGLPAVTTQPVAGAQGELVGLKMFQAYHRSRGDTQRDIVLIPHSAHGTNPATATMAGFETVQRGAETLSGVVEINAGPTGKSLWIICASSLTATGGALPASWSPIRTRLGCLKGISADIAH